MRKTIGFTLIEILVVLMIMSIVACVAVLSIRHDENQALKTLANEITQTVTLAEEQAMLQPNVLGLSFNSRHFQFASLQPQADGKKSSWTPVADKNLGLHKIPKEFQVNVVVGNKQNSNDQESATNPQIVISTSGDLTPFTIYVGKVGEKPRYAISGDADGKITNELLS